MERKAKFEMNTISILGIIFFCMGIVFMAFGIGFTALSQDEMGLVFLWSFGGTGLSFLLIGIVFLLITVKKKSIHTRLLQSGSYILAEISGVTLNYNIRVNGKSPYVVECRYQDGSGNVHIFKSSCLFFDPYPLLKSQTVKVYVEGENYKHYYVDIDEILPKVIRH